MSVSLIVEIPDDIAILLQSDAKDLTQTALEAVAAEGYRSGRLSHSQIQRLLGLKSRSATDEFLKSHSIFDYNFKDLESDRETLNRLFKK